MLPALRLLPLAVLILAACDAPPSVQKVIDEAEAKAEAAKPRLENPAQLAAQDEGREIYLRYLAGKWAPLDRCDNAGLLWEFKEDSFARPGNITDIDRPCKLAVVEALTDGSYAIAGFCPNLESQDAPTVVPVTRLKDGNIIIPGVGGGVLGMCE